jgi:hypothetical protein
MHKNEIKGRRNWERNMHEDQMKWFQEEERIVRELSCTEMK